MEIVLEPLARALFVIVVVILMTRLNGVRSFAKMSSFGFAVTVAIGSILASTIVNVETSIWIGFMALVGLFVMQGTISRLRIHFPWVGRIADNSPILVMKDGEILRANLTSANLTKGDLLINLRRANVLRLSDVKAVIVEPTGDVNVLHGAPETEISPEILEGVQQ